jgi:spore coat protein U-like protein
MCVLNYKFYYTLYICQAKSTLSVEFNKGLIVFLTVSVRRLLSKSYFLEKNYNFYQPYND